eukprot:scaffold2134_cov384-Prasinococcus_capsulatus_cf.AAC.9
MLEEAVDEEEPALSEELQLAMVEFLQMLELEEMETSREALHQETGAGFQELQGADVLLVDQEFRDCMLETAWVEEALKYNREAVVDVPASESISTHHLQGQAEHDDEVSVQSFPVPAAPPSRASAQIPNQRLRKETRDHRHTPSFHGMYSMKDKRPSPPTKKSATSVHERLHQLARQRPCRRAPPAPEGTILSVAALDLREPYRGFPQTVESAHRDSFSSASAD